MRDTSFKRMAPYAQSAAAGHPVLLLLVLMKVVGAMADFGIGFESWPPSEVIAVPGSQIRLTCATNVTAEKISWQYNHHFLLDPRTTSSQDQQLSQQQQQPLPPFTVQETNGGSELVINVGRTYEQYKPQLGLYQCVAWFGAVALTSLPGRLEAAMLEEFPQPMSEQVEIKVAEGEAARIECGNPSSVPDAQLTFYKDGKAVITVDDSVYHITPHGDLMVLGVGAWAVGKYTCSAHNPVLNKTVTSKTVTTLSLMQRPKDPAITPPQFVTLRSFYTANTGSSVRMMCLARGHPEPEIAWSKYGGALSSRSFQEEDGSLMISPVAVEDEGTYLCHASNGIGDEGVIDVSLEIIEPPQIVKPLESQSVEEGSKLSLTCRATGHPKPKVMWVFNGGLVRSDGNIHMTEAGLSFRSVEKKHAGIYQCFAHNPEGSVQSVAMINVVPKTINADLGSSHPNIDPTKNETKHGHSGGPKHGGGRGNRRGNKGRNHNHHDKKHNLTTTGNNRNETDDMMPDESSNWKKIKKGVMVPPSKPKMRKVSDDSVMVTWDNPDTKGLPVIFYKVQYKEVRSHGSRGSRWMTVDEDIPSHVNSFEVTGLETGKVYRFRIAAVYANNDNKLGPNSKRFLLEKDLTVQRPTYPPTIVSLLPQGPTAVKLEWEYEESPGVPIEGFFINYREFTTAGDYTKVTVLDPNAKSYVISHLKANVSYNFKMQSFNLAGVSEFSAIHKKNVAGYTPTTTPPPVALGEERSIKKNDSSVLFSNLILYVILGAVIGLLLLIVIVSSTIYACKNRHVQDDIRTTKYEDTSLHIHKEAAAYTLPQCHQNNGRTQNGYLSHQGVVVTPVGREKVAMESSFIENNNHNIQRMESCYSTPAHQASSLPSESEQRSNSEVRSQTALRNSSDTFESAVLSCSETDTVAR
ncbi:interference hedgehog-like isoform X1 [Macrobrachium rosenbergii]|uniref:interference hedgehog-like isoform X1 n=1 Tax=Macrobrachium rosenbergii TaxID=79674 RepID=UPI0034D61E04